MWLKKLWSDWLLTGLFIFLLGVLLFMSGYLRGCNVATQKAYAEKMEIINQHQSAILQAEQQYTQQLQTAWAEKQKWFDFAQIQSSKLAKTMQELDKTQQQLQEQVNHVVQKDGNHFNGIGADSVRLYNQAHGYTH